MLLFVLGALLGGILGSMLCVRYLRQEISADISPRLKRIQLQLDSIEAVLNLAITTRYTELISRPTANPPDQIS